MTNKNKPSIVDSFVNADDGVDRYLSDPDSRKPVCYFNTTKALTLMINEGVILIRRSSDKGQVETVGVYKDEPNIYREHLVYFDDIEMLYRCWRKDPVMGVFFWILSDGGFGFAHPSKSLLEKLRNCGWDPEIDFQLPKPLLLKKLRPEALVLKD